MLYLASQTTHAVAPALLPKVNYDPIRDFVAIVRVAHNPLLMVTHPSMPVTSFKELVALAKSKPARDLRMRDGAQATDDRREAADQAHEMLASSTIIKR